MDGCFPAVADVCNVLGAGHYVSSYSAEDKLGMWAEVTERESKSSADYRLSGFEFPVAHRRPKSAHDLPTWPTYDVFEI